MSKKITAFVDNVGRVIVGEMIASKNKDLIKVKEPAVVNVNVNQQSGQISVQLLPFIFREFISESSRESGVVWDFKASNITQSENLELDEAILTQYKNIFTKPVAKAEGTVPTPAQAPSSPEVVKLFDDED